MFCIKCGRRIPVSASKCPYCSAVLASMEYCSSFWSEVNQNSLSHNYSLFNAEDKSRKHNSTEAVAANPDHDEYKINDD